MAKYKRKIPLHGLSWTKSWWKKALSLSAKVAVYWPLAADSVTLVGYYDTVSEANAAALANKSASGAYPRVAVNFWHSDFAKIAIGARDHRDARVSMPSWCDEDPRY